MLAISWVFKVYYTHTYSRRTLPRWMIAIQSCSILCWVAMRGGGGGGVVYTVSCFQLKSQPKKKRIARKTLSTQQPTRCQQISHILRRRSCGIFGRWRTISWAASALLVGGGIVMVRGGAYISRRVSFRFRTEVWWVFCIERRLSSWTELNDDVRKLEKEKDC